MPSVTTLTSRELNQDVGRAKRAAAEGPVIITDRGTPAFVLLTFANYQQLQKPAVSLAEAVGSDEFDFDFEPPKLDFVLRPVDFEE